MGMQSVPPPRQAHWVKKEFYYLDTFLLILFLLALKAFDRKCQGTFDLIFFLNFDVPGQAFFKFNILQVTTKYTC